MGGGAGFIPELKNLIYDVKHTVQIRTLKIVPRFQERNNFML